MLYLKQCPPELDGRVAIIWYEASGWTQGGVHEGLDGSYRWDENTSKLRDGDGEVVPTRPLQQRGQPQVSTFFPPERACCLQATATTCQGNASQEDDTSGMWALHDRLS